MPNITGKITVGLPFAPELSASTRLRRQNVKYANGISCNQKVSKYIIVLYIYNNIMV